MGLTRHANPSMAFEVYWDWLTLNAVKFNCPTDLNQSWNKIFHSVVTFSVFTTKARIRWSEFSFLFKDEPKDRSSLIVYTKLSWQNTTWTQIIYRSKFNWFSWLREFWIPVYVGALTIWVLWQYDTSCLTRKWKLHQMGRNKLKIAMASELEITRSLSQSFIQRVDHSFRRRFKVIKNPT